MSRAQLQCAACGHPRTATDPADACPACGAAPADWREPHAADVIDDDDEMVVENAAAVEPPAER